jgi:N-acetylglucosamine malate deacetylase 1
MNVLLISAHPDDMEIGMGGTAAKLASTGASLTSLVLTDGRRSPNPFQMQPDTLAELRQKEARDAASILGIERVLFSNLADLRSSENYRVAKDQMRQVIEQNRPTEIYTLHPSFDRHASHQLAGKIVLETVQEIAHIDPTIWAYEVWGLFSAWDRFEDISGQIGKKIQAIQQHKSQVACIPYADGVSGLNRWRAIFADPQQNQPEAAFAEVFIRCSERMG